MVCCELGQMFDDHEGRFYLADELKDPPQLVQQPRVVEPCRYEPS